MSGRRRCRHARAIRAVRGACLILLCVVACVPVRGGWDVDALVRSEPALAALSGHRLGDLTPFPAFDAASDSDRLELVVCRFSRDAPVRVRGAGEGWPASWAKMAVEAVDRRVAGVELVMDPAAGAAQAAAQIRVVMVGGTDGAGPRGLGDTLCECDVARRAGRGSAPRGVLVGAEIRMRRARLDGVKRLREASAEEWIGAMMHELGHALGFAGHAAVGDSILVRDEMRLRAAARTALEDSTESHADRTLEALYALPQGRRLGSRPVSVAAVASLESIRAQLRERSARGEEPLAILSSVGDSGARIVWRYADGSQLGLRMPDWQRELDAGAAITLVPEARTQWLTSSDWE